MLMDEPFGALDPITRDRLQDEFLRLQAQVRKTVIFVTHDIDEAIKMGDRIAILREGGVLAQYDTPEEILADPADDFVARFVGADRGLKRLSLRRLGDLELIPARRPAWATTPTPRSRSSTASASRRSSCSTTRAARRRLPRSALDGGTVSDEGSRPVELVVEDGATLRDALSMMLTAAGSHVPVVASEGRYEASSPTRSARSWPEPSTAPTRSGAADRLRRSGQVVIPKFGGGGSHSCVRRQPGRSAWTGSARTGAPSSSPRCASTSSSR